MGKIAVKNTLQIEKMRRAGATAAKVLNKLAGLVRPGITTGEIDRQAAIMMEQEGCKSAFFRYRNFPGYICISVNEEVVHGIGGKRQINYGDLVKIDVGINQDGWIGDNARTIICGMVAPEVEQLCQGTHAMLDSVLQVATAGNRIGDISAHIEGKARAQGWGVVRDLVGHGVGYFAHEAPHVFNYQVSENNPDNIILKPGMVIAIEPMINARKHNVRVSGNSYTFISSDKSLSSHYEHSVAILEKGNLILTKL